MATISVVFITRNEENSISQAIASVKGLADEVIVVDMESTDKTVEVAKKLGTKIYGHTYPGFVEPVRNFAISKAKSDWVLVMDADEELTPGLLKKLKAISKDSTFDYYRIPRKNIIFGHWMRYARWWPDYNIRFFRKGYVSWTEIIHTVPMTQGKGGEIETREDLALVHHNYKNIDDYLAKLLRYSKIQSEEIVKGDYKFVWSDLVTKPVNEFLSRYFAGQGYKDGIHGLALSLLQAFSELVVYIRVWGNDNYQEKEIDKNEIKKVFTKNTHDISWWIRKELSWPNFPKFW